MLNLELARIIVAERRREADESVRQGRLRLALAERKAAAAQAIDKESSPIPRPGAEAGSSAKPALGSSR
jgi:hypothetical protein